MEPAEDGFPYLDRACPEAWQAVTASVAEFSEEARRHGLEPTESELIKLRIDQLKGCAFCFELHWRQGRHAGVTQQKIDALQDWRGASLFSERESAVPAIAEGATQLPLTDNGRADLVAARRPLGGESFVAAEWVATFNLLNRLSILSEHQVHPRIGESHPL
jgi:AhpD family alkylhydroperoxidase